MKFPRIPHLPWSPGGTNDDKKIDSIDVFLNKSIVISEKMDGSNLCFTKDDVFARSHNGPPTHRSFDLAKALHAQIRYNIQDDLMLYGEWCYAVHSIKYKQMPHYFLGFAAHQNGEWLGWHDTMNLFSNLKLATVSSFTTQISTEGELKDMVGYMSKAESCCGGGREGVVIRLEEPFVDLSASCAKWVRADHVQTDEHWINKAIEIQGK